MNSIQNLSLGIQYVPLFAGISAFVLSTCFYLYPVIIKVSIQKGLMDMPESRKMHKDVIPTLGGLGIFIVFSLSIIFFGLLIDLGNTDLMKLLALLGSTIILLFLGVKDDLVFMSPKMKLLGQFLAVINVVVLTQVRIISFEGLLGLGELPYFLSILFTVFVFILVINAVNLIDGIDGLAGSVSVISSLVFGILFFVNEYYFMSLISFVLIGSILGFLRYNLSRSQKIFMGDCGSMLAGFLLAYQGINLLGSNATSDTSVLVSNAPVLLLGILSYPLFDLLRVFTIRIKQGRSPFAADSNHIHHRLLRIGLDHKEATLLLSVLSLLVIGSSFLASDLEIHLHLFVTVMIGTTLYLIPFLGVFDKKSETSVEMERIIIPEVLKNQVNGLPGINYTSVVYSKRNDMLTKSAKTYLSKAVVKDKTRTTEQEKDKFGAIASERQMKIEMLKKKFTVKKTSSSSSSEKILE